MTHNFKPGDKITMRVGARSMYGTHLGGMKGAVRYATGYGAYPLDVTFEGLPFSRYCVRPEDVLLAEDDTAKIKAALAVVKAKGGYCSGFDDAVKEAENLDLLGRLKAVAEKRNRGDIYDELLKELEPKPEYQDGDRVHYTQDGWDWLVARIDGEWVWENRPWGDYHEGEAVMNQRLFPRYDREIINTVNLKPGREYPAYVMPEVPKVGDYVRLTMKDGKTREGKVRETRLLRNVGYEPTEVRLEGNYSGYGYCYGKDPGDFNPGWQIVKVEKIVRVPEIGKWIEATTHDGMYVIISGIKSEKTKNALLKSLDWLDPKVTGSKGNYQIKVPAYAESPPEALKSVVRLITNLTPDHLANLKWKVQK